MASRARHKTPPHPFVVVVGYWKSSDIPMNGVIENRPELIAESIYMDTFGVFRSATTDALMIPPLFWMETPECPK